MLQASSISGPAFSFWRLWIGAVALLGLSAIQVRRDRSGDVRRALRTGEARRWTLLAGASFGVHQLLFFTAVKLTSVVDVALMNALAPLVTAVGAWWLFRERPGARFWGWSVLAIGGGAFLAVGASSGPEGDPLGVTLGLVNVVFFAAFFLASKRSRDQVPVLPFLAGTMTIAAVLVSAYVLVAGEAVGAATGTDLGLAAAVALGPGLVGHFVMTWPLRYVAANIPPVMRLAQPAIAGVLAWVVVGEPLTLAHLLGGAVVVTGAGLAITSRDGRALQREARVAAAEPGQRVPATAAR